MCQKPSDLEDFKPRWLQQEQSDSICKSKLPSLVQNPPEKQNGSREILNPPCSCCLGAPACHNHQQLTCCRWFQSRDHNSLLGGSAHTGKHKIQVKPIFSQVEFKYIFKVDIPLFGHGDSFRSWLLRYWKKGVHTMSDNQPNLLKTHIFMSRQCNLLETQV